MTALLPPSRTDAGLVARYLDGDRHALADIYERWADRVHHRCTIATATSAEADRAYRDTFLFAAHHLGELANPDTLGGWLLHVADLRCDTPAALADVAPDEVPATPITLWSDVLTELMTDPIPAAAPFPIPRAVTAVANRPSSVRPAATPLPTPAPPPVLAPPPDPAPSTTEPPTTEPPTTEPTPGPTPAPAEESPPDTAPTRRWRPAWAEPFVGPASALLSVAAATTGLMVADAVVHQLTADDGSRLIVDPAAADTSTTTGPLDTTPPTIVTAALSETTFLSCSTVGGLAARVADDQLVAGVHASWAVGDDHGVVDLTPGNLDTWTGNVGPFSELTSPLGAEGLAASFTVTAIDGAGNIATATIDVPATVVPC